MNRVAWHVDGSRRSRLQKPFLQEWLASSAPVTDSKHIVSTQPEKDAREYCKTPHLCHGKPGWNMCPPTAYTSSKTMADAPPPPLQTPATPMCPFSLFKTCFTKTTAPVHQIQRTEALKFQLQSTLMRPWNNTHQNSKPCLANFCHSLY